MACNLGRFVAAESVRRMDSSCRKRKRAGGAGEPVQSSAVGVQEVLLPGWIDLNSSPLPPGWEQCLDLQSGKLYFLNAVTQTRVFEDPRGTMIGKAESVGLDLEMRLPCVSPMHHPKPAGMSGFPPSMGLRDIPNHCNGFQNHDISGFNPNLLMAPFDMYPPPTTEATNSIPNMAATVCSNCHTFVMVSRQSPHCPNCKNVCNMDLSISSGR